MKLKLIEIYNKSNIDRFVIESVDLSLYIAFVQINGEEHLIADNTGKPLKTTNLLSMQRQIKQFGQIEQSCDSAAPTMRWWGVVPSR